MTLPCIIYLLNRCYVSVDTHTLRTLCLQMSRAMITTIMTMRNIPALMPSMMPLWGSAQGNIPFIVILVSFLSLRQHPYFFSHLTQWHPALLPYQQIVFSKWAQNAFPYDYQRVWSSPVSVMMGIDRNVSVNRGHVTSESFVSSSHSWVKARTLSLKDKTKNKVLRFLLQHLIVLKIRWSQGRFWRLYKLNHWEISRNDICFYLSFQTAL